MVSRIDKIVGLFCKRALQKRQYSAKETYNFIDPTDRSHPIGWPIVMNLMFSEQRGVGGLTGHGSVQDHRRVAPYQ